jgi:hypothetical protein
MGSSVVSEKEDVHVDPANDTQQVTSTSIIAEKGGLDLEKAAGVQMARRSSSVAEMGENHDGPALETQDDTAALFQEPQIEKWRLVSLYVR